MKTENTGEIQQELNHLKRFVDAHSDIKTLLDNSASWADSQAEQSERSRRNAWRVAAAAGAFGAAALVVALSAIGTSYQPAPPPVVLRVDKATGHVERLVSLEDFQQTAGEATIRRNISAFMRARENYTFDTAEENYFDAAAFMSPQLQSQWGQYWDTANPKSPLNYYRKDTKVRIDIGSIAINRDASSKVNSARVSFTRRITQNDIPLGEPTHWLATIVFRWVNAPTQERARRVNDLGFEVISYDVDADLGPNAVAAVPVAPVRPAAVPSGVVVAPALSAPSAPANWGVR